MRFLRPCLAVTPLFALASACGGLVVVEHDGSGASGSATSTATTTSSGSGGCTSHAECGDGVCLFTSGTCAPACDAQACDTCGVGSFCEECATSSCPGCRDCVAACTPIENRCDDDDPCPGGSICHFREGRCSPACNAAGGCDDLEDVCAPCESSSCCGCKNCVSGCIPPEE